MESAKSVLKILLFIVAVGLISVALNGVGITYAEQRGLISSGWNAFWRLFGVGDEVPPV